MKQFTILLFNTEGRSPAGQFLESRLTRASLADAESDAVALLRGRNQRDRDIVGYRIFLEGVKVGEWRINQ